MKSWRFSSETHHSIKLFHNSDSPASDQFGKKKRASTTTQDSESRPGFGKESVSSPKGVRITSVPFETHLAYLRGVQTLFLHLFHNFDYISYVLVRNTPISHLLEASVAPGVSIITFKAFWNSVL